MGQLTAKLVSAFAPSARAQGREYYEKGLVDIDYMDAGGVVRATAVGSEQYSIQLNIEHQQQHWNIAAGCSCADAGGFCKHLWGTLLAVEDHQRLAEYGALPERVTIVELPVYQPQARRTKATTGPAATKGPARGTRPPGRSSRPVPEARRYRQGAAPLVRARCGPDWFDLQGEVDFEGLKLVLPKVLAAVRRGERAVRLSDGSYGMLTHTGLEQNKSLWGVGHIQQHEVRFRRSQIGVLDALLTQLPEPDVDRQLQDLRHKLQHFSGIQPAGAAAEFSGTLRGYQRQGLGWLEFLDAFGWGGCLADDMGLGKTVQVLALLENQRAQRDHGPTLIVVPRSLAFNWVGEAQRFTPQLRVLRYTGGGRKSLRPAFKDHDVVVTTYGTVCRDIEWFSEQPFNYVVLDEAQAIKNPMTQNAKAMRQLQARRRLVLTGTPVENHLGDLWSLFEFLNPGMLGSLKAFKELVDVDQLQDASAEQVALLRRSVRPFILRRTKEQVASELPPRCVQTLVCELGQRQTQLYTELRDHYRAALLSRVEHTGLANSRMHVLEALLRLRQVACHPGLVDEARSGDESAKLELLLELIPELVDEGHKALVFSQFTSLLGILQNELCALNIEFAYLDGRTRHRQAVVERFQSDPSCPLFLISLKAGGTGLNLTAADYVFILDPWWNPAAEDQAIDRSHRIGQDKKVMAYRLIAEGTVEQRILDLQHSKRRLAQAVISADNQLIGNLTPEDLELLLS